jgi:hypothetical protein
LAMLVIESLSHAGEPEGGQGSGHSAGAQWGGTASARQPQGRR